MTRNHTSQAEVARRTLRVQVADVAKLTREYARLGLRIVRQGRHRALIALPCGVILALSRRIAPRRLMVAA